MIHAEKWQDQMLCLQRLMHDGSPIKDMIMERTFDYVLNTILGNTAAW